MKMPEPIWYRFEMRSAALMCSRGYEHQVSIMLPWKSYNKDGKPYTAVGSPSLVEVGGATRHGTELSVARLSFEFEPSKDMIGEMLGELAESWVAMTMMVPKLEEPMS